jgi:transcriptional regulator with XRE-family HTH domain
VNSTIGGLVLARRKRLKLTQAQLANRAGVDTGTVSRLERGAHDSPSLPVLRKLAAALGCDVLELVRATERGRAA